MIRDAVGWSKRRMAAEMGIAFGQWAQYEQGLVQLSLRRLDRFRELTGIDPYVLAYFLYVNTSKLPKPVQEKMEGLKEEWMTQMKIMRQMRQILPTWQ